ncbi:MAG: hypothetical protein AB8F74_23590 [Saprospiraceae bacterium]
MSRKLFLPFFLLIVLSSCNRESYMSPALQYVRGAEQRMAILPVEVINCVERIPKGATLETLKAKERKDAFVLQRDLYRYCIREMSRQENMVDIQHVNYTNDLLKARGISYEELKNIPKEELAEILHVDAVIYSQVNRVISGRTGFVMRKIMNGVWGTRKQVEANFAIHQRQDGKMLWKHHYGLSVAGDNSVNEISKAILRTVSKEVIEVNR